MAVPRINTESARVNSTAREADQISYKVLDRNRCHRMAQHGGNAEETLDELAEINLEAIGIGMESIQHTELNYPVIS